MKYYSILLVLILTIIIKNSLCQQQKIADSLYKTVESIKNDTARIKKLIEYANKAGRSSLELAEILSKEILQQSIKANYLKGIGDAYNLMGIVYSEQGETVKSTKYYQKALEIYEKTKYLYGIVNVYNNLGIIYSFQGNYIEAIELYTKALKILETYKNKHLLNLIYSNLGRIYIELEDDNLAYNYLKKAEEICIKLNDSENLVYVYSMLGKVSSSKNKSKALKYYNKSLQLSKIINNQIMESICFLEIGNIHLSRKNFKDALTYYNKGYNYADKINYIPSKIRALNCLGYYHYHHKQYKKAKLYSEKALNLSNEKDFKEGEKNAALHLSYIYEDLKEYKKAYQYKLMYNEIYNSLYSNNTLNSISKLLTSFEEERNLYKYQLSINQKKIKNLILLIVSIPLILILTSIYIIQKRKVKHIVIKKDLLNQELTLKTIFLIRKNEIFNKIEHMINANKKQFIPKNQNTIEKVLSEIKQAKNKEVWDEFIVYFNKVHKDFHKKLNAKYPTLTVNEKRLCSLLKVNMKTKDISYITQQTPHAIGIARSRLRKKLGILNHKISLHEFLAKF